METIAVIYFCWKPLFRWKSDEHVTLSLGLCVFVECNAIDFNHGQAKFSGDVFCATSMPRKVNLCNTNVGSTTKADSDRWTCLQFCMLCWQAFLCDFICTVIARSYEQRS